MSIFVNDNIQLYLKSLKFLFHTIDDVSISSKDFNTIKDEW